MKRVSPAVFTPSKNIPTAAKNIFNFEKKKNILVTYKKSETELFLSYIMGLNYDTKTNDSDLDGATIITDSSSVAISEKTLAFIPNTEKVITKETKNLFWLDHKIHRSGGMYRKVTTASELDFKNKYLNLAVATVILQSVTRLPHP